MHKNSELNLKCFVIYLFKALDLSLLNESKLFLFKS